MQCMKNERIELIELKEKMKTIEQLAKETASHCPGLLSKSESVELVELIKSALVEQDKISRSDQKERAIKSIKSMPNVFAVSKEDAIQAIEEDE